MTASFALELDTRPPQLTWGAAAGAQAGQTLTVAYGVDEPELLSADLALADGRVIAATIAAGSIQVAVPGDAPTGSGVLTAHTVDDVLNAGAFSVTIAVAGVTPPPSGGEGSLQVGHAPGGMVR